MGFQFPFGFKFSPTDFELIYYYLLNKQTGKPLPLEGFVKDRDLYNEHQVLELFTMMKDKDTKKLYFFTCLKKKSDKGLRIDRTVGQKGTWKGLDAGKKILDKHGRHVGCKKTLDYENKVFKEYGALKMKEYSLDGVLLKQSDLKFKDIVLCQIKMMDRGSKRAWRDINVHQEQGAVTLFDKTEDEALVNYGCLYNKRIRASEGCNQHIEHLPVQSIARTPAASDGLLSRETQWHQTAVAAIGSTSAMLPFGYSLYDVIPMACAPPLKEAAPTVEQSSFSMGESDVRMLQQPSMIQKPAPESAMWNVGCENAIETPQGLRALDENVDYSDCSEGLEYILKDAKFSVVLASQTHWQQGDGVVTDALGTLPSCSPGCDVSEALLASMPSLKGIKPAPTVVTNAAILEENEVKHLEQSIARTPAASDGLLSRETQWHQTAVAAIGSTSAMLPFGYSLYDVIPMACAPPLKEAAPTVEQSSFSMRENDVRMLQQPSMIQKPAPESAMRNVGCENAIETPQGLRALDENVDYSDFSEIMEDKLKDAKISAVFVSQTDWQQGDGVVTDALGTLPSCSPGCNVSDALLASMPSLKGIKPAPTVATNAAILEENEVKHLEQPTTSYDPAPRPDMTNGGSEDKIVTPRSDLHELSLDKYDDTTVDEHGNWVEEFADDLLKDQRLPLQESEIQMLPNTSYSYGLHGLLGGGFLLPSQLKTK